MKQRNKITSTSIRIAFLGHLFSKKIPRTNLTWHNQLRSKRNSSLDQILFHPSWTLVPLFDKVKWQYLQSAPKNMLFLFRKMELFYHFTVKAGSLSHLYLQKSETNIYQDNNVVSGSAPGHFGNLRPVLNQSFSFNLPQWKTYHNCIISKGRYNHMCRRLFTVTVTEWVRCKSCNQIYQL